MQFKTLIKFAAFFAFNVPAKANQVDLPKAHQFVDLEPEKHICLGSLFEAQTISDDVELISEISAKTGEKIKEVVVTKLLLAR